VRGLSRLLQLPKGFEEAVCSLAKLERAIVSCPAGKARPGTDAGANSLLPAPPEGADRVEFELQLLSVIQVHSCITVHTNTP
jgi:hypothetical protein